MNKFFALALAVVFCIYPSGVFAMEMEELHECEDIHYRALGKQSQGVQEIEPAFFEFSFFVDGRKYRLTAKGMPKQEGGADYYFLEHKLLGGQFILKTTNNPFWNRIIRLGEDGVILSQTIIPAHPFGPVSINALFSTSQGGELVRSTNGGQIWRHDMATGEWLNTGLAAIWLGSWSVADNGNGTLILAEYCPDSAAVGRIFRSLDDGRSWTQVFSVRALGTTHPDGVEIRHFHTAAFVGGRTWIVSSGDTPAQSRMWMSEQDGAPGSWEEITDPTIEDPDLSQTLNRHTCWWMWNGKYATATDDTFAGRGARAWFSSITKPFNINVMGRVTQSDVRSAIYFPGLGWVVITENKKGREGIEVVLITLSFQIIPIGVLVGIEGFFTSSVASLEADGDVSRGATAYALAKGLPQQTWIWRLKEVFVLQPRHDHHSGTIRIEPEKEDYSDGEWVTITAIPNPGEMFQGWTDEDGGWTTTTPKITVLVDGDLCNLYAAFGSEEEPSDHKVPSMGLPWFVDGPAQANK